MTFTFDENIVSDLHKDARGFRPGQGWWESWTSSSNERKQQIWDSLVQEMNEEMDRERRMEKLAVEDFEAEVQQYIELGAGDRATALRWMTQNEEFYHEQDVEHWVWKYGILFTDYGRQLVKELMQIVTIREYA